MSDVTNQEMMRLLTEDIQAHRDYIHKLYRSAFVAGGVLITAAVGLGYWILGAQLDAKVFEYRISEALRTDAQKIGDEIISGAKDKFEKAVDAAQIDARRTVDTYVAEQLGTKIEDIIEPRVSQITSENLPDLVGRFAFPVGAVVAFDRSNGCPAGWETFIAANSRFIVGAGGFGPEGKETANNELSRKLFRELGGKERVILRENEIPPHKHGLAKLSIGVDLNWKDGGTDTNIPYFNVDSKNAAGRRQVDYTAADIGVLSAGGGDSHENMPPYIALYFCKKVAG